MKHLTTQSMMQEKLWAAAARGDSASIRILAVEGVDIDARNADGFTAYNLATQNGHFNTALTILAARNMAYAEQLGFGVPVSLKARGAAS
jgi:hypothetical protein